MGRAGALASHLPTLYREGELVDALNQLWGVELDAFDEASFAVQRAHWFDVTPDLDEAAALAALLDIPPEEFHADLGEYRAWVHALTNARLQAGAVTREALRILVDTYVQGFQRSADIDLVPQIPRWSAVPDDGRIADGAALVENPRRFRSTRLPAYGGWEPLARFEIDNTGIDPAPWAAVITGLGDGDEFAPFVANRTTGDAFVFRGAVPAGARLTIAPTAADRSVLRADLEGVDVSDRLDVYPDLVAGPAGPGERSSTATAPHLARGTNELWFLPLAHYDTPGLDRFLLAFADDLLRMGRFDETGYDHSLFAQRARIAAWVAWIETEPASFEIHLPAQRLRTDADGADDGITARDRLETGLDVAADRLAGVGIRTDVIMRAHGERQPGADRLTAMLPMYVREVGPTGGDLLPESEGIFDVTDFGDSVLR